MFAIAVFLFQMKCQTTPTLALPLKGRELQARDAPEKLSFPFRGKVGMGVVY
jgi:hypothetical protein